MKKRVLCAGILLAASLLTAGCNIRDVEIRLDTHTSSSHTVFQINKELCGIKEARLYLCNYKNLYGRAYGVDLWDYDFGKASLQDYVKDVTIDELMRVYCMDQIARDKKIELTSEEQKKVQAAAKEYFQSLSADEISYIGMTQSETADAYANYALAYKLYNSLTQGIPEEVSDDEARVIRIQQIYVASQSSAEAVRRELEKGEDFAAVAGAYNEAEVIERTVARGDLSAEAEAVAFELSNDEISGGIVTDGGYYFIKCISKFEEELTEKNKKVILAQKEKAQFEDAYTSFLDQVQLSLNEKLWDSVTITTEQKIETSTFFEVYKKYFGG